MRSRLRKADSLQKALPVAMELPRHKLAGFLGGFSLEAGSHIEASDRQRLEQMVRYMLRPKVANARLRKLSDGRVELTLKRPMHDGTRAIALTPSQLLRRLAAIVPPPRVHALRYFGALAPNAKLRPLITRGGRPPTMPDALDDGGAVEAQLKLRARPVASARPDHPGASADA